MMFSSQRLWSVGPRLTSAFPKHLNPPSESESSVKNPWVGGWRVVGVATCVYMCVFISAPEAKAPDSWAAEDQGPKSGETEPEQ